jgi:hypothetical protein
MNCNFIFAKKNMKNHIIILILLFSTSIAFGQANSSKKLGKSYGVVKVDTSRSVSVKEVVKGLETKNDRVEFTFQAPLAEICQAAGCWVSIDKGNGETFRVRFKDHFTIPVKTLPGTEAYFHGYAYWDEISVDLQKHFAEDAGRSKEEIEKISAPKKEMCFEADGIVLVQNKK